MRIVPLNTPMKCPLPAYTWTRSSMETTTCKAVC